MPFIGQIPGGGGHWNELNEAKFHTKALLKLEMCVRPLMDLWKEKISRLFAPSLLLLFIIQFLRIANELPGGIYDTNKILPDKKIGFYVFSFCIFFEVFPFFLIKKWNFI